MDGIGGYVTHKNLLSEMVHMDGGFLCNGAADPTSYIGQLAKYMTVTRSGAGDLLVTLDKRLHFPTTPVIIVGAGCNSANIFAAVQLSPWNNSTKSFHVGTVQVGALADIAAATGAMVEFWVSVCNSSSKSPR